MRFNLQLTEVTSLGTTPNWKIEIYSKIENVLQAVKLENEF